MFRVAGLLSFEQLAGQPAWVASARQRTADSVFRFGTDGSFSYTTSNVRTDTYPVPGSFSESAGAAPFRAARTATTDVAVNSVDVTGRLERSGAGFVITMEIATSSEMAATVDDTGFESSTSARYRATLTVTPSN